MTHLPLVTRLFTKHVALLIVAPESLLDVALEIRNRLTSPPASGEKDAFQLAVNQLKTLCLDDMNKVDATVLDNLSSDVAVIPELAGHLIKAGGKRLRPMLTIASARMLDYDGEQHIKLAAAVELIHGATLLHDDVVDGSALRRGHSTANLIWGNKESVLVGDFIFSRAFELMVSAGELRVLEILSRASGVIAEGEVMQLSTQKNIAATREMYLAVVGAKTAALFAAAARAGAVIANADRATELALYDFGRELGVAFQLVDDALDYSGKQAALGKSVGDDFREGKMTLPVVVAIERADAAELKFWRRTISDGDQEAGDFETALDYIERCGAIEETMARAADFAARACTRLDAAPVNAYSTGLKDLVDSSLLRGH